MLLDALSLNLIPGDANCWDFFSLVLYYIYVCMGVKSEHFRHYNKIVDLLGPSSSYNAPILGMFNFMFGEYLPHILP